MKRIIIGSNAFFKSFNDFKSKDIDTLVLVDNPKGFNTVKQIHSSSQCIFYWKRMSPQEYIDYALNKSPAMQLGKFLIPEFIKEINFTINDLVKLRPIVDKLDKEHEYEKIIYDAYIENNNFYLTDKQLHNAYDFYKATRINNVK